MKNDRSLTQCIVDTAISEYADPDNSNQGSWSDIDEIYISCAKAIVATGESVNTLISNEEIRNAINDRPTVVTAVNGLGRDLKDFADELNMVQLEHKGKAGLILTEEDTILSMNVYGKYQDFTTKFQSVTLPVLGIVTEAIGEVVEKAQAEQALATVKDSITEAVEQTATPVKQEEVQ